MAAGSIGLYDHEPPASVNRRPGALSGLLPAPLPHLLRNTLAVLPG